MTVLGTRPEIIRLSIIIEKLDHVCDHILVNTGQNFTSTLNGDFFKELSIRTPDLNLGVRADSAGAQIGQIITAIDEVLRRERPDRLLILGDTNSGLSAFVAKRLGIPVFHMEAGNRCYDDRVPEEVNRRVIDHSSDILMPYTARSRDNLTREGIQHDRIFVTGNPINEVLQRQMAAIERSAILSKLGLKQGSYFLVTLHRAENVDVEKRLRNFIQALERIAHEFSLPVVCSVHPRTRDKFEKYSISFDQQAIIALDPLGFHDFVRLQKEARCTLSDSGTVQEESCILGVPSVTLRDVTERPETIECGSNVLSGDSPDRIAALVRFVSDEKRARWKVPSEYEVTNVSDTVTRILLGHRE